MVRELFNNAAVASLTASATAGATTLTVNTSALYADPGTEEFTLAVIYDGTGTYEVVKVTDVPNGTSLTVTRNIAGTNQAWGVSARVDGLLTKQTMDNLAQRKEGCRIVLTTPSIDLKVTAADVHTFPASGEILPSGFKFYPLSAHVAILSSDTVSVDPVINIGSTTDGEQILAAASGTVTETNLGEVTTFTVTKTGVTAVFVSVDTGATATTLTGKISIEGLLLSTS